MVIEPLSALSAPRFDTTLLGPALFDAVRRSGTAITVTGPVTEDCRVLYCNEAFCRLVGYPAEEIIGRNCRFLQGPETDRKTVERIRRALDAGEEIGLDILNVRKDRERFWNRLQDRKSVV